MTAPTLEARLAAREKPRRSVAMYQRWNDLAFLHWDIEPEIVQASLPQGLHVDTFDGRAYIGFVPFFMNAIRPRGLPACRGYQIFWNSMCAHTCTTPVEFPVFGFTPWNVTSLSPCGWPRLSTNFPTITPRCTRLEMHRESAIAAFGNQTVIVRDAITLLVQKPDSQNLAPWISG